MFRQLAVLLIGFLSLLFSVAWIVTTGAVAPMLIEFFRNL